MTLGKVKVGDVVQCDKGGRIFYALVEDKKPGVLKIQPITPSISYYTVTSRETVRCARWLK